MSFSSDDNDDKNDVENDDGIEGDNANRILVLCHKLNFLLLLISQFLPSSCINLNSN